MRADAANLLARLGRRDFRYREFTDNFADMELWPIFEALLTDKRVVGKPLSALAARHVEDILPSSKASPARPPEPASTGGLFDGYGDGARPSSASQEAGELRSYLQRLSKGSHEGRD
ncbi:hypothetical protein [Sphingobium sp. TCM1]|uniref:hypothetical protein n=1 Tax=Sphingobium sp. TCM1 TaxID=453246 RepID=UPI0007F34DDC|nr:hypothetical protein [Sphingobium sp. TCM1]OAN58900.1 hypothetical protein A7Q26_11570 [Sphingobium sp. TCM1]